MRVFQATLQQMAVLFSCFALGFLSEKRRYFRKPDGKGWYVLYGAVFTALSVLFGFLLTLQPDSTQ